MIRYRLDLLYLNEIFLEKTKKSKMSNFCASLMEAWRHAQASALVWQLFLHTVFHNISQLNCLHLTVALLGLSLVLTFFCSKHQFKKSFNLVLKMPRHPALQSLQQICMNSVIENMENFWCQQFLKEMNQTHWLFVEGKKQKLPLMKMSFNML